VGGAPNRDPLRAAKHDEIFAQKIEAHDGAIIFERGEGDSVFAVFARASDAAGAACAI